jgi:hypothetical protein
MFVQVIQGHVSDKAELRAQVDQWVAECAPGAAGWLGSTSGVAADGTAVAVVRFESEEAARRNSERPEQDAWWSRTSKLFTDEPIFKDSTAVHVDTPGDPGSAGFVQVMQGRTTDPARMREIMTSTTSSAAFAAFRPEILGSVVAEHPDGEWTNVIYFTTEAAAREGEQKEPPPELKATMDEMMSLSAGELTFIDLTDPWFHAPE